MRWATQSPFSLGGKRVPGYIGCFFPRRSILSPLKAPFAPFGPPLEPVLKIDACTVKTPGCPWGPLHYTQELLSPHGKVTLCSTLAVWANTGPKQEPPHPKPCPTGPQVVWMAGQQTNRVCRSAPLPSPKVLAPTQPGRQDPHATVCGGWRGAGDRSRHRVGGPGVCVAWARCTTLAQEWSPMACIMGTCEGRPYVTKRRPETSWIIENVLNNEWQGVCNIVCSRNCCTFEQQMRRVRK